MAINHSISVAFKRVPRRVPEGAEPVARVLRRWMAGDRLNPVEQLMIEHVLEANLADQWARLLLPASHLRDAA